MKKARILKGIAATFSIQGWWRTGNLCGPKGANAMM